MSVDVIVPVGRERFSWPALVHFVTSTCLRRVGLFTSRVRIRKHPAYRDQVCVLAVNHRSFADPPLVGMCTRYANAYFARENLWKVPLVGQVLWLVGGIPVNRGRPSLTSMAAAVQELRTGRSLLLFPEGTRTKTGRLQRLQEGPAMFARRGKVPVVPVYLYRSEFIWPRAGLPRPAGGVHIRFGRPMQAPAGFSPRQQDRWLTRYLERWMQRQEADFYGD
jgi:1-acyl-sn-glycerol-3-phosphate acyltransferase